MEEIKVSEMLQADSINKDDSVMIIQEGVNKKASGSIQTATGTSLSLTSVADTCKVKSNSKNVFDQSQITNPSTGSSVTIVLTLKPNTEYTCSTNCPTSTGSSSTLIFFASGTSSSGLSTNTNGVWDGQTRTFTSDSNGNMVFVYRRLSSDTNVDLTSYWYQIEEGSTATAHNPYITNIIVRTKNLITNIIKGYALSGNTGDIAVNSQRAVSDFIKVEGGETYTRSGYTTSGLVWYNSAKSRISNDNSNPVTAPANAVYVRLGINTTADYSQAQFEKGTTATTYVKGESQEISLIPQEEKVAFTYDTETNILSDGSVTITYNTKGRLLNNDDTTAIKEYADRKIVYDVGTLSGSGTKSLTFPDISKYSMIEIIYANASGYHGGSVTLIPKFAIGIDFTITSNTMSANSDVIYLNMNRYTLTSTSITWLRRTEKTISGTEITSSTSTTDTNLTIERIIGYK